LLPSVDLVKAGVRPPRTTFGPLSIPSRPRPKASWAAQKRARTAIDGRASRTQGKVAGGGPARRALWCRRKKPESPSP